MIKHARLVLILTAPFVIFPQQVKRDVDFARMVISSIWPHTSANFNARLILKLLVQTTLIARGRIIKLGIVGHLLIEISLNMPTTLILTQHLT